MSYEAQAERAHDAAYRRYLDDIDSAETMADEVNAAYGDLYEAFHVGLTQHQSSPLGAYAYAEYGRQTAPEAVIDVIGELPMASGVQLHAELAALIGAAANGEDVQQRAANMVHRLASHYASQGCDKLADARIQNAMEVFYEPT